MKHRDEAAPDWAGLDRKTRLKRVRRALKRGEVEVLVALTDHNLQLFGRGGAHTSPHTRRAYATGVRQYLAYALPLGWKRLTVYDIDLTVGYLRMLQANGLGPGTVNARRTAARALYRALRWAGALAADPFADTPRAHDPEEKWAKRQAYSRADVAALLAASGPPERRLVLLGAHAALRMAELVSLTWDRVDLDARTLRVTGKGSKTATVHLSGTLWAELGAVPPGERVGTVLPWVNQKTVRDVLRHLCLISGVRYEGRQVHGLRHAAATMLLEDTRDLTVVARHLRHSSVSTTEIYAKLSPERLTSALRAWDAVGVIEE
jgi:integrase/recombinase XerC